jgi:hypothetical protein
LDSDLEETREPDEMPGAGDREHTWWAEEN